MDTSSQIATQIHTVRRVTLWGLLCNLVLSVLKCILGVVGHSQALVADAVHSLSDSLTDVAVLVGVKYWTAPPDAEHPHGHGRIETAISFFLGVVLASVGVGLTYHAMSTLHSAHQSTPGWPAFIGACCSILVKEALYQWSIRVGRRIRSTALLANAWHHRSDALSSAPVAVAVLAARIDPSWGFLDHVATAIVAVLILHAAWSIAWPALRQLLDAGVSTQERKKLHALACTVAEVREVHALRTRHIGPGVQVDLHVQVDPEMSVRQGHRIAGAVKARLLEQGEDVVDVLVHLEPHDSQ